jgi:hypothetical protein
MSMKKLYKDTLSLGTRYLCAETEDDLRMFCSYCKNKYNIDNINAHFNGYLNKYNGFGFPVYIEISKYGINHISWSRKQEDEKKIISITYKGWKDKSIDVKIFCNPDKNPEYFI